jgi:hypothetical protein
MKDKGAELNIQAIRNYISTAYPDHTYDSNLLRFAVDRSVSCGNMTKTNNVFTLTAKGELALKNFDESFTRGTQFGAAKKKKNRAHVSARVNQLAHEAFQVSDIRCS